jgi:hypothetical protein
MEGVNTLIPIEYLKKIETVSSLKLIVYFYENANEDGIVRDSISGLVEKTGLARNSVNRALTDLLDNGVVNKVADGKGNQPNTYKVSSVKGPMSDGPTINIPTVDTTKVVDGWKKATGSKKEPIKEPSKDLKDINNILYKDFKEYNFINNNINSLSVVNENIYLTDEELGKLARRVLMEWFLPLSKVKSQNKWFFPQQMKLIKDLLVKWRTEQVLAGIQYWASVNPPKDGIKSVAWLNFEKKKVSHIMVALDYYKQQYLFTQADVEEEERKAKVEEMKVNALEIVRKKQEEKKRVAEMSDNDFLSDLLGGFGTIKKVGE